MVDAPGIYLTQARHYGFKNDANQYMKTQATVKKLKEELTKANFTINIGQVKEKNTYRSVNQETELHKEFSQTYQKAHDKTFQLKKQLNG